MKPNRVVDCRPTILVETVGTIPALPPSPNTMLVFHGLRNQDSFHRSIACFNIVWGKERHEKGSERRKRVAYITMEACMYSKFSAFRPNLTSVPTSFDPYCSCKRKEAERK